MKCTRRTQGGKGNEGMFIERDPKVCAAGKPTSQATESVAECLKYYLLKDEVDSLICDAIIPVQKQCLALKSPKQRDMRNAVIYTDSRDLINPTPKTKFVELVEEFKNTTYNSYWNSNIGTTRNLLPLLPEGFKIQTRTLGRKTEFNGRLYDLVLPKDPPPDGSSPSKHPGSQTDRNYCKPPYNPNLVFGIKYDYDKRGEYAKCCLTDDRVNLGTSNFTFLNAAEADFKESNNARFALSNSPNDNISCVPPGFSFGILKLPDNLPECLTTCALNRRREFLLKCLGHLNTLRKCLSKRQNATFFHRFYLRLKYFDKTLSGWLPKKTVYDVCAANYIRFDPSLIEPLLQLWHAFDGSKIQYNTFTHVINYREPSPSMPKIEDVTAECLHYFTTYGEMVKPGQETDNKFRAGLPSGRYFDKDYPVTPNRLSKADEVYLPEESDSRACLNPSILTAFGISHRDMFTKRSPEVIRKVFETAGETQFTDEQFNQVWEEAKTYHSQGWVSYATFKRALYKDFDEKIFINA